MNIATERKLKTSIGLGGASLLMILTVLALTAFAVLSLATASAQRRLAETNASYVQNYYTVDAEAEKLQALVAEGLRQSRELSEDPEAYAAFWDQYLQLANYNSQNSELQLTLPLIEGQELQVVLAIDPTAATQRITSWTIQVLDEGDYTVPLQIWPGE